MLVLITYDVNTETSQGKKRLRKVAKECVNYGHRVQNSVFECVMDAAKCVEVKEKLKDDVMESQKNIKYLKIINKQYAPFMEFLLSEKEKIK